jgi:hypothetical protein
MNEQTTIEVLEAMQDKAWKEWLRNRSDTLNTRHNEIIFKSGHLAGHAESRGVTVEDIVGFLKGPRNGVHEFIDQLVIAAVRKTKEDRGEKASYEELEKCLLDINNAARMLPTFKVVYEGKRASVVSTNSVVAIEKATKALTANAKEFGGLYSVFVYTEDIQDECVPRWDNRSTVFTKTYCDDNPIPHTTLREAIVHANTDKSVQDITYTDSDGVPVHVFRLYGE